MDQEPTPAGTSGKAGAFQKINGVIAGLTGLVIAVGGLAAATKGVVWDKEDKAAEEQSVVAQPVEPAPVPKDEEPAPQTTLYKGDLYNDGDFTGGSVQLEKTGDTWTLTAGNDAYSYDELATNDKSHILAVSGSSTLRWPVKGGVVEESEEDRRDEWKTYARVDPSN